MRKRAPILIILLASLAAIAGEDEPLEQLKARAEQAGQADQAKLFIEIARRQLKEADKLYESGHLEAARALVAEIATYSERAGEAARSSGKRLKDTEVSIRKMSKRLSDMRRALTFEERPPLDQAVERMEKVRTDLLTQMFSKKGKKS